MDDEDKDPDFNPEGELVALDDDTIDEEEEDTFQVEKHSHALNFMEAGGICGMGARQTERAAAKSASREEYGGEL